MARKAQRYGALVLHPLKTRSVARCEEEHKTGKAAKWSLLIANWPAGTVCERCAQEAVEVWEANRGRP